MKSPKPKGGKPQQSKPQSKADQKGEDQPLTSEEKLTKAQANADHWSQIAADPQLSPEAASIAFNLARSYRAQVDLRQKAAQEVPQDQNSDPYLARVLGMDTPSQNPPTSSPTSGGSSTKPGISDSQGRED